MFFLTWSGEAVNQVTRLLQLGSVSLSAALVHASVTWNAACDLRWITETQWLFTKNEQLKNMKTVKGSRWISLIRFHAVHVLYLFDQKLLLVFSPVASLKALFSKWSTADPTWAGSKLFLMFYVCNYKPIKVKGTRLTACPVAVK